MHFDAHFESTLLLLTTSAITSGLFQRRFSEDLDALTSWLTSIIARANVVGSLHVVAHMAKIHPLGAFEAHTKPNLTIVVVFHARGI